MTNQRPYCFRHWVNQTSRILAVSLALGAGLTACSSDEEMTSEVVTPSYGTDYQESVPLDVNPSGDSASAGSESPSIVGSGSDSALATVTGAATSDPSTSNSENFNPTSDTVKAELTDSATPSADVSVVADSVASDGPTMFDGGVQPVAPDDIHSVSSPGVAQNLPDKKHRRHSRAKPKRSSDNSSPMASTNPVPIKRDMSQYVIEPGDTLATISQKIYGTVKMWQELADGNGLTDPDRIFAGDVIRFDARADKAQLFVKNYKTTMKTVVVKKGDSLSKIAAQTYGSPDAWPRLMSFNRDKIRDPNHIAVGLKLDYMEGGKFASLPKAPATTPTAVRKSILLPGKVKAAPTH